MHYSLVIIFGFSINFIFAEEVLLQTHQNKQPENQSEKLHISIFYQTLCPYSIEFFREQLIPVWEKIGPDYLDLRFVPYGNAHTFFQPGLVIHGCDHGVEECYGNKLHACVLEYLPKEVARDFIFCSMKLEYPPDAVTNCSSVISPEYNFNSDVMDYCVNGLAGDLSLALKGLQSLDFVGQGVPSISLNGVLTESEDALEDFLTYICDMLRTPPRSAHELQTFELPQNCKYS